MFDRILLFCKNNKVLRLIGGPVYRFYIKANLDRFHKRERTNFKKWGLEAIKSFDECMTSCGYRYTLATGTLLGAIREGGFIPHDEDIDVFMLIEDYSPVLKDDLAKYGFKLRNSFSIENDLYGKEDSFVFKGVQIDIFYVYDNSKNMPYFTDYLCFEDCISRKMSIEKHGGLMPRKLYIPPINNIKRIKFESLFLPVPDNADALLRQRYGDSYMIPNPNWKAGEINPYVELWPEKIGVFTKY